MIKYEKADKYCVINDKDSLLRPIVIQLPTPPPIELIDGYGLPKVEQKFKRREIPVKLQLVEKRARKKADEFVEAGKNNRASGHTVQKYFWEIVEDERDSLEEEIKWIKNTYWFLRHGYWFFNYGKPTWISPWHFFYLNFYYIDEASCYPDYRDVDRRTEIAEWYAYTCTETFKDIDKEGRALSTEMIDMFIRLFFGTIRAKRRRGGATAQSLAKGLWIFMSKNAAYCDIIADTGEHAEGIFAEKLSPAWYHYPLCLKPVWDGDERPVRSIKLVHPKSAMKEDCLGGEFGFTKTSTERANDSRKLSYLLSDEEGKGAVRGDIKTRWGINKETMAQNLIINGYSNHPSTVEDMKDGGKEYRSLFDVLSDFYVRKPNGQTLSGLLPIFTKSIDGMDGFIDTWGYSVINTPTIDQLKYAPEGNTYAVTKKGAKQTLEEELATYLNDGSQEKLKEYRELLRKKPMDSTDCWKGAAGDMGFNIIIIDKAIIDAKYKDVIRGNFRWAGGIRDTRVIFERDESKGRWYVSDLLSGRENRWKRAKGNYQDPNTGEYVVSRTPFNPLITTGGVDAFNFRSASTVKRAQFGSNTNLSDGGLCVFLNYDASVDGDKPEHEWDTPRFICTYRNSPPLDEYCEDALMMCFYYGCMCIGERNVPYMIDYFIKRGYAGYLLYLMDATGKVTAEPWVFSGGVSSTPKNEALGFMKQHIDIHGHKECHVDLLEELKNLSSPEDLNTKDLAAAAIWALYGSIKGYQRKYERITNRKIIDISGTCLAPKAM